MLKLNRTIYQYNSINIWGVTKQRHYYANKVRLVKAMFFPVVIYGCDSWTIKRAES